MLLIFIVCGEDVEVQADLNGTLRTARDAALLQSYNTGRPAEEWEIRDANGVILPADSSVGSFNFQPDARIFLTLRIGAGG